MQHTDQPARIPSKIPTPHRQGKPFLLPCCMSIVHFGVEIFSRASETHSTSGSLFVHKIQNGISASGWKENLPNISALLP
jgi:hypothetical protein